MGLLAQVLNLKGIRTQLHPTQSEALWSLGHLEELVLDCDQPPEAEEGAIVTQQPSDCWGLPEFPDGMLRLRNLTHLTLSCHYAPHQPPLNHHQAQQTAGWQHLAVHPALQLYPSNVSWSCIWTALICMTVSSSFSWTGVFLAGKFVSCQG